ncbi:MAG: hypothetical protein AB1791_11500 [Chloroflexota bacterium]
MSTQLIQQLLQSPEPAVRYKVLTRVLGQDPNSAEVQAAQEAIRTSPRVQQLLSERDSDGRLPHHPYTKWDGAHWVLAGLADLGYPPGDTSLIPLREQVLDWLLGPAHQKSIRVMDGRTRRCASQEGNAVYSLLALGLADERVDELAGRLARWQWPDGGWNCDRHPEAHHSSFHETLIPLRGLAWHARLTGNTQSRAAAGRAAEVFLQRRLYKRLSDGSIIDADFMRLHYPSYWHYDVLSGLKVLQEAGYLADPRCQEALAWLVARELPSGGWPADKAYYRVTDKRMSGRSLADWGGTSTRRLNEFVTADALAVLTAAGWGDW